MLTKKIKTRLLFLFSIILITISFLVFIYFNLKQNILYFKTPSEIFTNNEIESSKIVRVGGMVKKDSIIQTNNEIKFILTDYKKELGLPFIEDEKKDTAVRKSQYSSYWGFSYSGRHLVK